MNLKKGIVVKYKDGWMLVRSVSKTTVSLGPIGPGPVTLKGISHSEVYPDYETWRALDHSQAILHQSSCSPTHSQHVAWAKSETHQRMLAEYKARHGQMETAK